MSSSGNRGAVFARRSSWFDGMSEPSRPAARCVVSRRRCRRSWVSAQWVGSSPWRGSRPRRASVPACGHRETFARIRRYCARRIPASVAHLVRLEIDVEDRSVTILERRPPWSSDMGSEWNRFPTARLRFIASRTEMTLYRRHANLQYHRCLRIDPSRAPALRARNLDLKGQRGRDIRVPKGGLTPLAPTIPSRCARERLYEACGHC